MENLEKVWPAFCIQCCGSWQRTASDARDCFVGSVSAAKESGVDPVGDVQLLSQPALRPAWLPATHMLTE